MKVVAAAGEEKGIDLQCILEVRWGDCNASLGTGVGVQMRPRLGT